MLKIIIIFVICLVVLRIVAKIIGSIRSHKVQKTIDQAGKEFSEWKNSEEYVEWKKKLWQ